MQKSLHATADRPHFTRHYTDHIIFVLPKFCIFLLLLRSDHHVHMAAQHGLVAAAPARYRLVPLGRPGYIVHLQLHWPNSHPALVFLMSGHLQLLHSAAGDNLFLLSDICIRQTCEARADVLRDRSQHKGSTTAYSNESWNQNGFNGYSGYSHILHGLDALCDHRLSRIVRTPRQHNPNYFSLSQHSCQGVHNLQSITVYTWPPRIKKEGEGIVVFPTEEIVSPFYLHNCRYHHPRELPDKWYTNVFIGSRERQRLI